MYIKKMLIVSLLVFASLMFSIQAAEIQVNITEIVDGQLLLFEDSEVNGVLFLNPEFFNTGSIGYDARLSLELYDQDETVYKTWSRTASLMPGDRKSLDVFWFKPGFKGSLTGKISVHYGDKVLEHENIIFEVVMNDRPLDVFNIQNIRVYDDYIRFDLNSNTSVDRAMIFIREFPEEWVFGQGIVYNLNENRDIEFKIPYNSEEFSEEKISIGIVTNDGNYYSEKSFIMRREEGLSYHLNLFVDYLKNVYRSLRDLF